MTARRELFVALATAFVLAGAIVACGAPVAPTPAATPSGSIQTGLQVVDTRLMPPMLAIAQHPEWAPGSTSDLNAHRAFASLDELCVEVARPNLLPLYVTVDVDPRPWTVKSIVVFDPATDVEPRVTYDSGDPDSQPDLCRGVLRGAGAPFPADSGSVEVVGGVREPAHARAIAQAIVANPSAFGIDRSSRPAINMRPLDSAVEGRACYEATVFQGGPRAAVKITLLRDGGAWRLHDVRIYKQALLTPEPLPRGAC